MYRFPSRNKSLTITQSSTRNNTSLTCNMIEKLSTSPEKRLYPELNTKKLKERYNLNII